ncbi:MAG TPA: TPM domain-containing protein [Casimicrobiaceae bacterium]|nr:TPM domain-containing protein [Casimicrobiaceae bacterium]
MANGSRFWRHIVNDHRSLRRTFDAAGLARIEQAIAEGEKTHGGQVVFAVESALPLSRVHNGVTPRARALEVFGLLRVWDTEHNNGVLIYLLLADQDVEIVADRGVADTESDAAWRTICADIERACAAGRCVDGAVDGIRASAAVIARRFPCDPAAARNELPDKPVVL